MMDLRVALFIFTISLVGLLCHSQVMNANPRPMLLKIVGKEDLIQGKPALSIRRLKRKQRKSTKTRLVFQAIAKFPGVLEEFELANLKAELIQKVEHVLKEATRSKRIQYKMESRVRTRNYGQRKRPRTRSSRHLNSNEKVQREVTTAEHKNTPLPSPQIRERPATITQDSFGSNKTLFQLSSTRDLLRLSTEAVPPERTTGTIETQSVRKLSPARDFQRPLVTHQAPRTTKIRHRRSTAGNIIPEKNAQTRSVITKYLNPKAREFGSRQDTFEHDAKLDRNNTFAVYVTTLFHRCLQPIGKNGSIEIPLESYAEAYDSLCKIFDMFGPIFAFAGQDIQSKLKILRSLQDADFKKGQTNYMTMESMFAYEYTLQPYYRTGVRSNTMIFKALNYIAGLVEAVQDKERRDIPMSTIGTELYNEILAPDHPIYVKAIVYAALMFFPTRQDLLDKLNLEDNEESRQILWDMSQAIYKLYYHMDDLYGRYQVNPALI